MCSEAMWSESGVERNERFDKSEDVTQEMDNVSSEDKLDRREDIAQEFKFVSGLEEEECGEDAEMGHGVYGEDEQRSLEWEFRGDKVESSMMFDKHRIENDDVEGVKKCVEFMKEDKEKDGERSEVQTGSCLVYQMLKIIQKFKDSSDLNLLWRSAIQWHVQWRQFRWGTRPTSQLNFAKVKDALDLTPRTINRTVNSQSVFVGILSKNSSMNTFRNVGLRETRRMNWTPPWKLPWITSLAQIFRLLTLFMLIINSKMASSTMKMTNSILFPCAWAKRIQDWSTYGKKDIQFFATTIQQWFPRGAVDKLKKMSSSAIHAALKSQFLHRYDPPE